MAGVPYHAAAEPLALKLVGEGRLTLEGNIYMKKYLILAVFLVSAAAQQAQADEGKDMEAKTRYFLRKIDSDGDGFLTREEHRAFAERMFQETDANNDGRLTLQELTAQKNREYEEMKQSMPKTGSTHGGATNGGGMSGSGATNQNQ